MRTPYHILRASSSTFAAVRCWKVAFAVLLLATGPGSARAQEAELPTLIVAPFSGDMRAIQYWQPAMGEGLAEMLVTEMSKISKFTVLETSQLGVLKDEIKQGEDGWIEAAEKVEKGGFAAADFMFTAKVTRFGNKESKLNLGGFVPRNVGKLGVKQTSADVRIDWRLVDASNRKVIKAGSATAAENGTGFDVGVNLAGRGGQIGFDNKEFMASALGKATVKALALITTDMQATSVPASGRKKGKAAVANAQEAANAAAVAGLRQTPGKVLAVVSKDAIIVSLGSKHGLKEGERLGLFETVEIKDDKGAVVFAEEKLVGEVVLRTLQEERSKASYDGDLTIKPGWVVKVK
jgi:curli biogenesis system outer membrane secretion channel CsgG